MDEVSARLKILAIKSPIQRETVIILNGLQGYSKRVDLLRDQLRKILARKGIGPARINQQLSELVKLRLAKKKPSAEGERLALNKDIWNMPPNAIEFVRQVTEHFAKEMRADAQFHGVLKVVKSAIRKSGRLPGNLSSSSFEILATCVLRHHPDWEYMDGQVVRKSEGKAPVCLTQGQHILPVVRTASVKPPQASFVLDKLTMKTQQLEAILKSTTTVEDELLPLNIDFAPVEMESILPPSLIAEFGREHIRFISKMATIDIPLSLGRGQRVYVTLRRNAVHEKVFWLFSVCGLSAQVETSILDILRHNDGCEPFKVASMVMSTGTYIGVCSTVKINGDWEKCIPNVILNLAAFADRIEEIYWRRDEF